MLMRTGLTSHARNLNPRHCVCPHKATQAAAKLDSAPVYVAPSRECGLDVHVPDKLRTQGTNSRKAGSLDHLSGGTERGLQSDCPRAVFPILKAVLYFQKMRSMKVIQGISVGRRTAAGNFPLPLVSFLVTFLFVCLMRKCKLEKNPHF